jgi:hypothetical protein
MRKNTWLRLRWVQGILCLFICLGLANTANALSYNKTTVTPPGQVYYGFAVNDRGLVAWVGNVAGVAQIFLYNGQNTQITANTDRNISIESLQINNQGQIAWSQFDYNPNPGGEGVNQNVYLYDGNTYKPINVNVAQYGSYSRYPHLNNRGEVAWVQSYQPGAPDNNLWDVYFYTGTGVTRLTNDLSPQGPPRLNDNGWVTWHGNRSEDWDYDVRVYLYTGSLPAQVIAYTPGQGCSAPQINNLNQVAWKNWNGSAIPQLNLYLWNGTNTKITNLDATNYDNAAWILNNNGQILWGWSYGSDPAQLYLYGAGGTKKITDDGNTHYNYGLADNGWIMWMQNTGQMAGDLYAYRNGSSCRLDTGVGYDGNYINSRGQVVWGHGPIFLASPVIASPGINSLLLLN